MQPEAGGPSPGAGGAAADPGSELGKLEIDRGTVFPVLGTEYCHCRF